MWQSIGLSARIDRDDETGECIATLPEVEGLSATGKSAGKAAEALSEKVRFCLSMYGRWTDETLYEQER